jgi:cell wall-associated NlpC family hydrolase
VNARAAAIAQMARQRGLDPRAVLAIASVEGGFHGSIGDHGTSFGPFQMHEGGALPRGIGNPQQWANSRAGIAYALNRIAGVAHGLRGQAAVQAISSRFERPANVPAEISKAMGRYGQFGGAGNASAPAGVLGGVGGRVQQMAQQQGGNPSSMIAAQMLQQAQALAAPAQPGQPSALSPGMPGSITDPSSLLAMAEQRAAMSQQQNISLSPGGKLTVANANGAAPEDLAAVKLAEHYLGTPYVYGGDKPGGFDCSGLLQFVWAKNGVHIPRTTYQQWSYGKEVGLHQLQPGDAVFFRGSDPMMQGGKVLPGHVAMYIGNGKVIQAPHTGADVQISSLDAMGPIMGARSFTG